MKKGQGTFEYILLLAGILLIVVLAIVLLRGGLFGGTSNTVQVNSCRNQLAQSGCYYANGSWNPVGAAAPSIAACAPLYTVQAGNCPATAATGAANGTGYCCGAAPV